MREYIYDKTFKGFLTAAAMALEDGGSGAAITSGPGNGPDLFTETEVIETDPAQAARLLSFIEERSSPSSVHHIWLTFLSEAPGAETGALEYIKLLLEKGAAADDMLADDRVILVRGLTRKTGGEAERFKGFVRFKELADKTLYAKIEPDHNILPLITPHFRTRMGPFNWVLHDAKRNKAAFYFKGKLLYAPIDSAKALEFDGKEDAVQALWKSFFKTIAIKERLNPKLQRQFVPLKYRKHLTEFD